MDGNEIDFPLLPTIEEESLNENNQGVSKLDDAFSQGEAAVSVVTGGPPRAVSTTSTEGTSNQVTIPVPGNQGSTIACIRVRTPRHMRNTPVQSSQSSLSKLMHFMLVCAKTESRVDQRRRQDKEDLENCHCGEREEAEDQHRQEREEAEEKCRHRMECQLQN